MNRFSRGILRVEDELKNNGNGGPEFQLHLETAFLVVIDISQKALLIDNPINDLKNTLDDPINTLDDPTYDPIYDPILSERQQSILDFIQRQPNLSRSKIAEILGISKETVKRDMLKMTHLVRWTGSPQNGHWKIE